MCKSTICLCYMLLVILLFPLTTIHGKNHQEEGDMSEKEKDTYNLNPWEGQVTLDLQLKTGTGFDVGNVVRDEWKLRVDPCTIIPVNKQSAVTIVNIVNDVQYDVYVQNNSHSSKKLEELRIRKIAIDFTMNPELEIEIVKGLNRHSSRKAFEQAFDTKLNQSSFFDERGEVDEVVYKGSAES